VDGILAATTDLIAVEGIRGITTDLIARSAQVSTATVYRYFADFEGVFIALGARIWHEDLTWLASTLVDLADGVDPTSWAEAFVSGSPDSPIAEPGRVFVTRAMDAVPSMRPILGAGYDAGGKLFAESVAFRSGCDVTIELLAISRATYRMLHFGLDAALPDSGPDWRAADGYLDAISALLTNLVSQAWDSPNPSVLNPQEALLDVSNIPNRKEHQK
jgi:AcrR family transcriptional regulator